MSLDLDTVLRVMAACDAEATSTPFISIVMPRRGGGVGQVFLEWQKGKLLKDYLRDPRLMRTLSLYQAAYSRILDHRNIKRRLTYAPQPGDEMRFIRAAPIGEM